MIILLSSLVMVACSKQDKSNESSAKTPATNVEVQQALAPVPTSQSDFDIAMLTKGGQIYKQNCAQCHGNNAEGNPDWRKRKADGKLLPPPLDGTGHTWHHSKSLLISIINNGTVLQGGEMPAWKGKLSQQDIEATLIWVQSKWPAEIYENWLEINNR